jgi:hypothetical protein
VTHAASNRHREAAAPDARDPLLPASADADETRSLADELAGITAMVAEKFTNDRTAEGIQRAQLLTVGGMSLGLEYHLVERRRGRLAALGVLIGRARNSCSSRASA